MQMGREVKEGGREGETKCKWGGRGGREGEGRE